MKQAPRDRMHLILDVKQGEQKQSWEGCSEISRQQVCAHNYISVKYKGGESFILPVAKTT